MVATITGKRYLQLYILIHSLLPLPLSFSFSPTPSPTYTHERGEQEKLYRIMLIKKKKEFKIYHVTTPHVLIVSIRYQKSWVKFLENR